MVRVNIGTSKLIGSDRPWDRVVGLSSDHGGGSELMHRTVAFLLPASLIAIGPSLSHGAADAAFVLLQQR